MIVNFILNQSSLLGKISFCLYVATTTLLVDPLWL
nr:MAG TPA: hypothetical protein [Caudoviricetes sp.]